MKQIVMERTFKDTGGPRRLRRRGAEAEGRSLLIEEVWALWTTKDGIESWWGPDGFRVEVTALELRPGGVMDYVMIAERAEMVAFMKQNGMPVAQPCRITFKTIEPLALLVYSNRVDFVPGTPAYDVDTRVELTRSGDSVRMVLTFDAMHDEMWTQRASMGWAQELDKLAKRLQR